MAFIDANNEVLRGVDTSFVSPFPSQDALVNDKFLALIDRPDGNNPPLRAALLNQLGCNAWQGLLHAVVKRQATMVGDFLPEVFAKASWVASNGVVKGVMAEASFLLSADWEVQKEAMIRVAMTTGLDALSAVPVYGRILSLVAGIALQIAQIFGDATVEVPRERRIRLPWDIYQKVVDEDIVNTVLTSIVPTVDWTPLFAPPTTAIPWRVGEGVDKEGRRLGWIFAPVPKSAKGYWQEQVDYTASLGVIPNTFRCAGVIQRQAAPQPSDEALRFYQSGELISWGNLLTNTGAFYPSLAQLGLMWQQVAVAGSPNLYKVDAGALEVLWASWFETLYASAFEQGVGDLLLPYLAHRRNPTDEYTIGVDGAYVLRPRADVVVTEGAGAELLGTRQDVPLVTPDVWAAGLASPLTRTPCLFTEGGGRPRVQTTYPKPYSRDAQGRVVPPPAPKRRGETCIPWPPGELLLRRYERVDRAITTPACRHVARLQRDSLARSLVCAYVRPDPVDGRPAYAAFADRDLHDRCIEMRQRLLTHPARFNVHFETARDVDPAYAEQLRAAGVPTTQAQRAVVKQLAGGPAARQPLDPSTPPPPPPDPVQGGLPFEPPPPSRGGLGAVALGGSAAALALWRLLR